PAAQNHVVPALHAVFLERKEEQPAADFRSSADTARAPRAARELYRAPGFRVAGANCAGIRHSPLLVLRWKALRRRPDLPWESCPKRSVPASQVRAKCRYCA